MMRVVRLLALLLLVAGCQPGAGPDADRVWDLRSSHTLADVGWPEGHQASELVVEADRSPVTVLLPGGLELTEGRRLFARLAPGDRPDPEDPGATELESVGVAFPNEDADLALQRAQQIAAEWDVDISDLVAAHARQDGQLAYSERARLDDASGSITLRARRDGSGYVVVDVHWGLGDLLEDG
jgi:hypothetical protein